MLIAPLFCFQNIFVSRAAVGPGSASVAVRIQRKETHTMRKRLMTILLFAQILLFAVLAGNSQQVRIDPDPTPPPCAPYCAH
jgi:hypothetical protein